MDEYEPPERAPGAGLQGRPKGCGEVGDMKRARGLRFGGL